MERSEEPGSCLLPETNVVNIQGNSFSRISAFHYHKVKAGING